MTREDGVGRRRSIRGAAPVWSRPAIAVFETFADEPGAGRRWRTAAIGVAVGACLIGGWRLASQGAAAGPRDSAAWSGEAKDETLQIRSGETLAEALRRLGVTRTEAAAASVALTASIDPAALAPDTPVEVALAHPGLPFSAPRLVGVSLKGPSGAALVVARGYDGELRLRPTDDDQRTVTTVASGVMEGSLYQSAEKVGADLTLIAKLVKLFSRRLDFARDIHPGDRFALVFDRKINAAGATVETGDIVYAEMAARGRTLRFYAFNHDGETQFFDETGRSIKGLLLKTPVDGARITSAYGMREHPLLGYTRMHQGIDFGAETGTPVLAAGDGVVVETRPWGGYGNWLRIRHADGWETGYGHLSAYARGLRPGDHVVQGQVVAYVGATGLATGPHLHYEVWRGGGRVNPIAAAAGRGASLWGSELAAFRLERARIDALRAQAGPAGVTDGAPRLASVTAGLRS